MNNFVPKPEQMENIARGSLGLITSPQPVEDAPVDSQQQFNDGDLILQAVTVENVLALIDGFCYTANTRSIVPTREVVDFCLDLRNLVVAERS